LSSAAPGEPGENCGGAVIVMPGKKREATIGRNLVARGIEVKTTIEAGGVEKRNEGKGSASWVGRGGKIRK